MSDEVTEPTAARSAKPTARAVATLAGVSVTTVSRVLNNRGQDIPAGTRARVVEAARQLRYRPNSLAAALRQGYSRTVGLVVPDIGDAYFHQIARGVDDVARTAGYTMLLCTTDREPERERSSIISLYERSVDAIIFAGGGLGDETHLMDLPWDLLHVVTVGPHLLPFPNVCVDDAGTIRAAMRHLFEQGCARVLCVGGQENWRINTERLRGYREALDEAALPYDPALVMQGDFGVEAGRSAVTRALTEGLNIDAVMAFNDYTAAGACAALKENGLNVPGDVAVVGCDNIALASLVTPQLTSVGFPQYEFGATAMQTALNLIAGQHVEPIIHFEYELVIRDSSVKATVAIA